MQPSLRITLLGDFNLALGDEPITSLNSPRLQALLTYLILHREAPQRRQHIAFLFWTDSSEQQALTNLRKLLHELRASLPNADSYISLDHSSVHWHPGPTSPFEVDVDHFVRAIADAHLDPQEGLPQTTKALQKAVDLYAGDLLPSCYNEWITAQREKLRDTFLVALHMLVDLLELSGQYGQAIRYARRLLRYDPLVEDNYRRLMRLHLLNNDLAGALNVYKQCALMMKREFGIEPGQGTLDILKQADEDHDDQSGRGLQPSLLLPSVPAQTTAFVGRESELAELSGLLHTEQVRLVTLIGMAGMGKTRLSIQASAGLASFFQDGVYFVPLASITDHSEEMVIGAIASALDLAETGGIDLRLSLKRMLADKRMLIILDNFEQILPAASVVSELLAVCPLLKVLVTSRAPLNLRGEHEFPVQPLPVPPADTPVRLEEMIQYESVALFVDRALEVDPRLDLTSNNLRAIADICRHLEGLPLSIELAAARVKVLSPPAIVARLDRRLKLLIGGKSDLPPRQRALVTAIDWSYNLLSDTDKALFRGVSVFVRGCTLEAAQTVCGHTTDSVLDGVASLVNKSLFVRNEGSEGEPRFSMLETLRDYAAERLAESDEVKGLRQQHALYFLQWAEQTEPQLVGADQATWLRKMDLEHDNLRAALSWYIAEGDAVGALRLTGALGGFWQHRSYFSEGREWLAQALNLGFALPNAHPEHHRDAHDKSGNTGESNSQNLESLIARSLHNAGFLAMRQGDHKEAQALCTRSLEMCRALGEMSRVANILVTLGNIEFHMGDYKSARHYCEEGLHLSRELQIKSGISFAAHSLGLIALQQGHYLEASLLFEESRDIERESGAKSGIALSLLWSARLALNYLHDAALARSQFEEALLLSRELGNRWLEGWLLLNLGEVARYEERYEDARQLYEQSRQILKQVGERGGVATSSINLASLLLDKKQPTEDGWLLELLTEALPILQENNDAIPLLQSIAEFGRYWARHGQLERAATLFGATYALQEQFGAVMDAVDHVTVERWIAEAKSDMDAQSWQTAWANGAAMTLEQAIALAASPV